MTWPWHAAPGDSGGPALVGIIANPAAGSDIRRLVALGSVSGTQDKINLVQRLLVGLLAPVPQAQGAAAGVEGVYLMPDLYGIGRMALARLPASLAGLRGRAAILDMAVDHGAGDTTRAARLMRELGAGCIVVLGGDGTSRAAARGCGRVPLLPISMGTNNVIPYLVEGTVAGLAAGFVARHPEAVPEVAYRHKWLEVLVEDAEPDLALVDVAVVDETAPGSRAVWEPHRLRQAILTRASPATTGISSLAGFVRPVGAREPRGLSLRFGRGRLCRVTAPLAPGLMASVGIEAMDELLPGDEVCVAGDGQILALDGEREIPLRGGRRARIRLRDDGPWIVDAELALQAASARGMMVEWAGDDDARDQP